MQASWQNKYEREKRELEQSNAKILKQLEAKMYDLETSNRVRQTLYVKLIYLHNLQKVSELFLMF